jgi:iron complex transport system permease protein
MTGARILTARRFARVNLVFTLALALAFIAALLLGFTTLDVGALIDPTRDDGHARRILIDFRLPRALLAIEVGAALAAAGVAFQSLLRNPLADPYILGVSGGAALGGTTLIAFGVTAPLVVPLGAYAGAIATSFVLFAAARTAGRVSTTTLLLSGVVFNAFAAAAIMFLKMVVAGDKAQELLYWLMGRLGDESYATLGVIGAYLALGLAVLFSQSAAMNALHLGEDTASALGVNVLRTRRILFWSASLIVAGAVAVSGMIGFVGIITPHLVRRTVGADTRLLLPASALAGAAFMLLSDTASRLLFPVFGTLAPVGVVTAFVGGPLLIWLIHRDQRGLVYG